MSFTKPAKKDPQYSTLPASKQRLDVGKFLKEVKDIRKIMISNDKDRFANASRATE